MSNKFDSDPSYPLDWGMLKPQRGFSVTEIEFSALGNPLLTPEQRAFAQQLLDSHSIAEIKLSVISDIFPGAPGFSEEGRKKLRSPRHPSVYPSPGQEK